MCLLKTGTCYHSVSLYVTAVLFQGIGRERQMPQMTELWKCRRLPFAAVAGWSSMGELGKHCSSQKQKLSLPRPSSGREMAVGKPSPSPSHGKTIPKPGPILLLRERHSVFPVWQTCLELSPSRSICSSGLISDLCELETDNGTVKAEC